MGQSVNSQLGTDALGYGVDPDYLRSQIMQQREKGFQQIQNPFQQAAARLGTILGGGIANVANDRGFFEVSDPLLTKVTQIQGIYNQVAQQVDPNADPEKFFSTLQRAYSEAGMGQQALMAAREAQKAKTTGMDIQIKETTLFEKNPELLAGRITAALESGNEAEATRLANLNARLTEDRDLKLEKARTDIAKDKAYIGYQKALAEQGRYSVDLLNKDNPLLGFKRVNTKTGEIDFIPLPKEMVEQYTPAAKDAKKSDKEKAPLNSFETNTSTATNTSAPAAAPAAAPVSAPPADMSAFNPAAYNQNAGTYRLDADPIIKMISDYAGQNRQLLETNPEFAKSITAAYENRKQELSRVMGTGVRFQ
jgi:chemotaxis protein histidine kinase CheA